MKLESSSSRPVDGSNFQRYCCSEQGVSLVEVGVIVSLIIVVCMAGMAAMGNRTGKLLCEMTNSSFETDTGTQQGFGWTLANEWDSDTNKCQSSSGFTGGPPGGGGTL